MRHEKNNTFHRGGRFLSVSSLLSPIIESKFFLTAKGKLIDTYELHSFGVGLLMGLLTQIVPQELKIPYWGIVLTMLTVALGIDGLRDKPTDGKIKKAVKKKLPLQGQIKKEGQYFIMGIVLGYAMARSVIFLA